MVNVADDDIPEVARPYVQDFTLWAKKGAEELLAQLAAMPDGAHVELVVEQTGNGSMVLAGIKLPSVAK